MITNVPGFLVGHHTMEDVQTGCTVILCPPGTTAGGIVCGGWPASRDTVILDPTNASPGIDAVAFSGRSVYGLGVADGVIRWVHDNAEARGVTAVVPQVPAAAINDLRIGDMSVCPTAEHGYLAAQHAQSTFARGSVGAGIGGTAGWVRQGDLRTKGGLGSASISFGESGVVGALSVVNPFGDVFDEQSQVIGRSQASSSEPAGFDFVEFMQEHPTYPNIGERRQTNTTLVFVATNAKLTKTQCAIVARMAQAGMAQAIRPVFTPFDGDIIIAASSGEEEATDYSIGILAAEVVAASIRDAVRQANGLADTPDTANAS